MACLAAAGICATGCAKGTGDSESSTGTSKTGAGEEKLPKSKAYVFVRDETEEYAFCNSGLFTGKVVAEMTPQETVTNDTSFQLSTIELGSFHKEDGWNDGALEGEPVLTENEDGSLSVSLSFRKDLKWSDGSQVTAEDYALLFALKGRGDFRDFPNTFLFDDGFDVLPSMFAGYRPYRNGTGPAAIEDTTANMVPFAGVRILSEYSLELTVDAELVPTVREGGLSRYLTFSPVPKSWMPEDVFVLDDGNGVFLSSAAKADYLEKCYNGLETKGVEVTEKRGMIPGFERYENVFVLRLPDCETQAKKWIEDNKNRISCDVDVYYQTEK